MKAVKMKLYYRGINPGEIAGFDDYEADRLIKLDAAELYKEPEPKKADKIEKADDKKDK